MCGERVVFLDPEVKVKTCPNCGLSVRLEGAASDVIDELLGTEAKRSTRRRLLLTSLGVGLVLAVLAAFGIVGVRRSIFVKAAAGVVEAEAAAARNDYSAAEEGYSKALQTYRLWFASGELTGPVEAALANVRRSRDGAVRSQDAASTGPVLLGVPLEELARQAYSSTPEGWQRVFERDYAFHVVVIRAAVEEKAGEAYRASGLTMSYRIFNETGQEVRLVFDPPFFERYRLGPGADCIVSAYVSRMYPDKGAPGGEGQWVLVMDGSRSGLVTEAALLKGLGWRMDDEVESILTSQRGLSPVW
jgi:hypothetical protein